MNNIFDKEQNLFADPYGKNWGSNKLEERFIVPPFSVLDAKQGYWRKRKNAWIGLGLKGDLIKSNNINIGKIDREDLIPIIIEFYEKKEEQEQELNKFLTIENFKNFFPDKKRYEKITTSDIMFYEKKIYYEKKLEKEITTQEFINLMREESKAGLMMKQDSLNRCMKDKKHRGGLLFNNEQITGFDFYRVKEGKSKNSEFQGNSIFDPVLCELMFKWFSPKNACILDPFAGECTKGVVATYLGYEYTGIEVRQEQIDVNYEIAKKINVLPNWIKGDSFELDKLLPKGKKYDFVFTSPPYYDLEIYSKEEKDGSAFETYEKFIKWYEEIFKQAINRMNENRFLVVKIGEIRDEKGIYRNFVGHNIDIFTRLGLKYYNEIILITTIGSLPVRIGKQFEGNRKIGKTHQNVLVFYKGDEKKIKDNFGLLDMRDLEEPFKTEEDINVEDL